MKIRHVLPGNNLVATYILKSAPYYAVRPLIHQALVTRDGEDEIIGFVLDKTIKPADVKNDKIEFLAYENPLLFPKESNDYQMSWSDHLGEMQRWGQKWAQRDRPAPEIPEHLRHILGDEENVGQG